MPRALPRQVTTPVVTVLARLGVTPNMLTIAQLIGGIFAGCVIATGELVWGGVILLVSATLDAFDGSLARATGKATRFGGVFDSVIDRLFEGAVLGGILYYYLDQGQKAESMAVFAAMVGSICVSYVRARAEAEGIEIYDGLFTRFVRIVALTIGLVANLLDVVIWVLAVMTIFTTFHRLFAVRQKLRDEEGMKNGGGPPPHQR
jgi:CDP-diacylglycerol--glycerol-3-phosphate 3-phosphatidyltransferase